MSAERFRDILKAEYEIGIIAERQRCLAIAKAAVSAAAVDGRDLVVRTDIIRKIENPTSPVLGDK